MPGIEGFSNLQHLVVVNQCNLSINSTESLSFSIHPNPVVDILHIEFAGAVVEKVILFDTMGRKVLEESGIRQISVSHLSKGSYILKIFSGKAVQTEKIIIGR